MYTSGAMELDAQVCICSPNILSTSKEDPGFVYLFLSYICAPNPQQLQQPLHVNFLFDKIWNSVVVGNCPNRTKTVLNQTPTRTKPKIIAMAKTRTEPEREKRLCFEPNQTKNGKIFKALTQNNPKFGLRHRFKPIFGLLIPTLVFSKKLWISGVESFFIFFIF